MFVARRRPNAIMPAATVALVKRSMRMNAPVSRFSAYGSKATGVAVARLQNPISFKASVSAAMCSSVLTSTLCFNLVIRARTYLVPIRSR